MENASIPSNYAVSSWTLPSRASLTPPGNPQPGGIVGIEDIIDG